MKLEEWLSLAVAVGTGLLAMATFGLTWFTWRTAQETKEGLKQADRHHQENLRPFCVIEFWDVNVQNPFGSDFTMRTAIPGPQYRAGDEKPYISIRGRLVNKGLGPAKDIVVYLNSGSSVGGQAYWLTHPVVVCGLLAAGESIEIDVPIREHRVATTVAGGQRVPTQALEWAARDAYEVVIRYRDIFENPFRTVHARGFPQNLTVEVAIAGGDVKKEKVLAARQDKPTPVFLEGEQPWRTLADMPQPPVGWLGSVDLDTDAVEAL